MASSAAACRAVAGVAVLSLLMAACGGSGSAGGANDAATAAGVAFLHDWAEGNLPAAAALTTDPKAAAAALEEFQTGMRPDTRVFTPGAKSCPDGRPCALAFDADLRLDALGHWRYSGSLPLVQSGPAKRWLVQWAPSVIHPQLTATSTFKRVRSLPDRAPILDRYGKPLVQNKTVIKVGVTAGSVPDGTIEKLSELLNLDVDGLTTRTSSAKEGDFVEAAVLRQSDYNAMAGKLAAIGGVTTRDASQALAPTRQFAREVLGAVATATASSLANAGETASAADSVGSFGLQAIYQRQLAGRPSGRVLLVDRASGKTLATLATFDGAPGLPVHTTLDAVIQEAADKALAGTSENSSLVAIDTRTGDVLAVANGPADKSSEDRALNGRYEPGSTFKIITAQALLQHGVKTTDTVPCPSTVTVQGKQFSNYDGLGSLGDTSFERDFTESCNTAFIGAAGKLSSTDLANAADAFGVHGSWDLGLTNFSGDVPPAVGAVEQAADAIGQGRVVMSPLAMAVVAAAVASGTPHTPRLVLDGRPLDIASRSSGAGAPQPSANPRPSPAPLPALASADVLRALMLETVRSGTARVLRISGEEIGAKTGTAQYGSDTQPGKHAWMVGFLGDVAFALIVERGDTGATTAGPPALQFLRQIKGYARNLPQPR